MRPIKAPSRFGYVHMVTFALTTAKKPEREEPKTYTEAINCKEYQKWLSATHDEMNSLNKNETWVLVDKPREKILSTAGGCSKSKMEFED